MHAILKRHHPQLHLTIYSTDTGIVGVKTDLWTQLLFASLVRDIFQVNLCGINCFLRADSDSRHCLLLLTPYTGALDDFFAWSCKLNFVTIFIFLSLTSTAGFQEQEFNFME